MKKLLSVLGALGIISSSASTLVSCGVSSSSLTTYVNGQKFEDKEDKDGDNILEQFTPPTMNNPIVNVAGQLMNLISISKQKPTDEDDAAMIGDAKKYSIEANLESKDQKFYGGDAWGDFKKDYRSGGNSLFTDIDIETQNPAVPEGKVTDSINVLTAKTDVSADNAKVGTLTDFVDNLPKNDDGKINDDFKDLQEKLNLYNTRVLPFGKINPNINFAATDVTPAEKSVSEDEKPGAWNNLADWTERDIPVDVVTKTDGNGTKTLAQNPDAKDELFYEKIEAPIEFKTIFKTADGVSYNLEMSVTGINLVYELVFLPQQNADKAPYDIAAFLAPIGYTFTDNPDYLKKDVYSSIDEGSFHVNVTKGTADVDWKRK